MTSNLAEKLEPKLTPSTPEPIVDPDVLKEYVELSETSKNAEAGKKVLNAQIKDKLGAFLLSSVDAAIESEQATVEGFLAAQAALEDLLPDTPEYKQKEMEMKALHDDLTRAGISDETLDFFSRRDLQYLLKHKAVDLEVEGYSIRTSIQDRSKMNQDKAITYLRSIGREDLITTQEVVNDAALEVALYNRELDAKALQSIAVEENLIVALYVKKLGGKHGLD